MVPVIQEADDSKLGIGASREEFAATCFPCVEEVLSKTGIKASEIDFVVSPGAAWHVCVWGGGGRAGERGGESGGEGGGSGAPRRPAEQGGWLTGIKASETLW
mgnify:CR=1 FL=1